MPEHHDSWTAGSTYENFMGRWSRRLAPHYVAWLGAPRDAHWLDVGCGTGALVGAVCDNAHPASVVGCDPADPFIQHARARCPDPRASFAVAGVGSLPKREGGYGVVASMFALNFFPDPAAALSEMRALAAPGATLSVCVWDYAGRMDFLRHFWDAALATDPRARELDEGTRFPICQSRPLTQHFTAAHLTNVHCDPIDITTKFSNFDDFWTPFLGGTGPAPAFVAMLDYPSRDSLANRLRESLPIEEDKSISLTARAWAVRGTAD
jgi:SAM-dependent methyltransferase